MDLSGTIAALPVRALFGEDGMASEIWADQFEDSINALANHRITMGCNPPANTNYCPDMPLTRAQMATFFVRAMG